jgi:succinate dehydrogenase / fumarate reductase, cytochrome b subunit
MQLSNFYTSSIGRKLVMASTGLFLTAFLTVHLGLNTTIWAADGGVLFDRTAHLLRHNWGLHLLEILVFSGFVIHIWQGASLTWQNKAKRRTAYAVSPGFSFDPARFMGILGTIILAFLLLHLYQFWLPNLLGNGSENLSELMRSTFSQGWVVAIYVLGCWAVAAHLWHGWRSAATTFGIADKYLQLLSTIGITVAVAVPLGLAAIPIALFISAHA